MTSRLIFSLICACLCAMLSNQVLYGQLDLGDEPSMERQWGKSATKAVSAHFQLPRNIKLADLKGVVVCVWADLYPDGKLKNVTSLNHKWARGKIPTKTRSEIEMAMKKALLSTNVNFPRPTRIKVWQVYYQYAPWDKQPQLLGLAFKDEI